jgi:CubicO group peptidase (beta-lactamase class C family)
VLPADRAREFLAAVRSEERCARVTDVLVQQAGRTLVAHSVTPGAARDLFSVTKTVLTILTGIAVDRGLLDPERPVRESPGMAEFDSLGAQTVRHLLTMTRGAAVGGEYDLDEVAVGAHNWAAAFARSPQLFPPGTHFAYDNGASQLLAEAVHRAVPGGLQAFAVDNLLAPLGISGVRWDADPSGTPCGAAHLHLSAGDLARVGRLLLDGGAAGGRRVVPADWVAGMREAATSGGPPEHRPFGEGLWLEADGSFFGAGWAGQLLYCRPADGLVLVTLSDPAFEYGPPATDQMPPDWLAPLQIARSTLLAA